MIPPKTYQTILDTADLVQVVEKDTPLQRQGGLLVAHCPLGHDDKTPSFKIRIDKGTFYCYSCGEGGNVVNYVMAKHTLTWIEAIYWLADFYHIAIEEVPNSPEQAAQFAARKQQLADLETRALQYEACLLKPKDTPLEQHAPYQYLMSRGITLDTIKTFDLGYGGLPDRYHNRITFAIRNHKGECVGFAGRIFSSPKSGEVARSDGEVDSKNKREVDSKKAKYINSAETPLYKKSFLLYGLYQAKQPLRTQNTGYLVEGYTDVLAMHQHGLTNTVASCGTALTKEQVALLKRFTSHITILFDGDSAGQKATIKAIKLLLQGGLLVDVVHLPGGQDPAEYLVALAASTNASSDTSDCASLDASAAIAALRKDFLTYLLDTIPEDADVPARVAVHKTILEAISGIADNQYRHEYAKEFASRTGRLLPEVVQEVQQLMATTQKHNSLATARTLTQEKASQKHKTTPDGTHYLVDYKGAYPLTFQLPIPVDWAKHWCEIDKQYHRTTIAVREWIALEGDLVCTLILHGDMLLHQADEQYTLKECIQDILKEDNIQLEIPIFDCILFEPPSTVIDNYDYAPDILRIRSEIETGIKLWEIKMEGLSSHAVDIPKMAGQLIQKYEALKKHMKATELLVNTLHSCSSKANPSSP